MNTKINLMYRDGCNYKTCGYEVLAGEITPEQIKALAAKLADGVFVIAEQVGLPTLSFLSVGAAGWPEPYDHVFTTLLDFEEVEGDADLPTPEQMLTDEAPSLAMDITTFVEKVLAVQAWDVQREWSRMVFAGKYYNPFAGPDQGLGSDGPSVVRVRS